MLTIFSVFKEFLKVGWANLFSTKYFSNNLKWNIHQSISLAAMPGAQQQHLYRSPWQHT